MDAMMQEQYVPIKTVIKINSFASGINVRQVQLGREYVVIGYEHIKPKRDEELRARVIFSTPDNPNLGTVTSVSLPDLKVMQISIVRPSTIEDTAFEQMAIRRDIVEFARANSQHITVRHKMSARLAMWDSRRSGGPGLILAGEGTYWDSSGKPHQTSMMSFDDDATPYKSQSSRPASNFPVPPQNFNMTVIAA